jgi:hypothetical protein
MMLTETLIKNRTLTNTFRHPDQTPHKRWTGKKPDLSDMREIGCRAFVLKLPKSKNPKVFNRSVECVMIGYSPTQMDTYQCYERKTGRIHTTRNVDFIESQDKVPRPLKSVESVAKGSTRTTATASVRDAAKLPDSSESSSKSEEEPEFNASSDLEEVQDEHYAPDPPPNVGRSARTHTVRGDNGEFPSTRKDDAVAEARAAESRAKERRRESA